MSILQMEIRQADLATNWKQNWRYKTDVTTMYTAQGGIVPDCNVGKVPIGLVVSGNDRKPHVGLRLSSMKLPRSGSRLAGYVAAGEGSPAAFFSCGTADHTCS